MMRLPKKLQNMQCMELGASPAYELIKQIGNIIQDLIKHK